MKMKHQLKYGGVTKDNQLEPTIAGKRFLRSFTEIFFPS
jgi:hypothetical protein